MTVIEVGPGLQVIIKRLLLRIALIHGNRPEEPQENTPALNLSYLAAPPGEIRGFGKEARGVGLRQRAG